MYCLTLELETLPKSLNKKLRSNRFRNYRENLSWDNLIASRCYHQRPTKPLQKCKIEIVRHSYRFLDFDGLVGSMKPVIDALVTCGVLIDDNWKVTGPWIVEQKFRPKKLGPLLEIKITESF